MTKYYVSCGEIRQIICAQDAESAALEALANFFEPHDWIFDCDALSDSDRRAHVAFEALTRLGVHLVVSQRGYRSDQASMMVTMAGDGLISTRDAPDPLVIPLADVLDTYFRLQTAISRYAADLLDKDNACDSIPSARELCLPVLI